MTASLELRNGLLNSRGEVAQRENRSRIERKFERRLLYSALARALLKVKA